jgi:peroxiredoxin
MTRIRVGTEAPPIVLSDQDGRETNLADFRGRRVLLSFHPLAWTNVCQRQMEALEMNFAEFERRDAVAFGISVDPVPSKKAWADAIRVEKTRLLSDFWPHGAVASSLGLFREAEGFSERASVVVDASGTVRYVRVYPIGEVPNVDELLDRLEEL